MLGAGKGSLFFGSISMSEVLKDIDFEDFQKGDNFSKSKPMTTKKQIKWLLRTKTKYFFILLTTKGKNNNVRYYRIS